MRARDRRWLTGVIIRLTLLFGTVSMMLTCSFEPREYGYDPGYVRFSGDLSEVSLRVDGGKRIPVRPSHRAPAEKRTKGKSGDGLTLDRAFYRIGPGEHRIKVYRNNRLLVSKRMFFPSSVVADVQVP